MERKNLWQTYSEAQIRELEEVNAQYRTCLDEGKTERECVKKTIELAEAEGYRNMKDLIKAGTKIHAGIKYIWIIWEGHCTFPGRNSAGRGRNEYSGSTY